MAARLLGCRAARRARLVHPFPLHAHSCCICILRPAGLRSLLHCCSPHQPSSHHANPTTHLPPFTELSPNRAETAREKALRQQISDLQIRVEAGEADAEYEDVEDVAEEGATSKEGAAEEAAAGGAETKEGEEEEEAAAPKTRTVAQALEELEARLTALQLKLDARAKYARAAGDRERGERGDAAHSK